MKRTMNMKDKLIEAVHVLIESGMDVDDAYIVLQAQCYILMDLEIDDYITDDDYEDIKKYKEYLDANEEY